MNEDTYFARVEPVPKFTETPGVVDVVFEIDEDRVRYIRNLNIALNGEHPHTMEVVPVNQFQLEPGDLADPKLIRRGRTRINGAGILEGVTVNVVPVDENRTMQASHSRNVRGQNGIGNQPSWTEAFGLQPRQPISPAAYGHSFPHTAAPQIDRTIRIRTLKKRVQLQQCRSSAPTTVRPF